MSLCSVAFRFLLAVCTCRPEERRRLVRLRLKPLQCCQTFGTSPSKVSCTPRYTRSWIEKWATCGLPVDYPWFTCVLPVQNIAKLIRSLSFNVLFYLSSQFLKVFNQVSDVWEIWGDASKPSTTAFGIQRSSPRHHHVWQLQEPRDLQARHQLMPKSPGRMI